MKSLGLGLLFASLVSVTAQPPVVSPYSPPANHNVLGTTFVDWDSLVPTATAVGQVRAVFDNPTLTLDKFEVHITTLLPGKESHPVHRHPWEEILLIKEGSLEVSINGRSQHAGAGAMVFLASNDAHNARNAGSVPATYYVVNFVTDAAQTASDKSAAEQNVPGKLASSVIDCDSMKQTPTPTGSRVTCVSSPTLTFVALESHITTLNVGQSSAPDIVDPNDEFVLVRSGSIEVKVNGVASRMRAGSMLYWYPNDKRTVRNIGDTAASYQVIRVTSDKSPKAASVH